MKKYLILLFAALAFTLTSCEKDTEPGGTAVQDMAGDWWVTYEYESSPGVWEDLGFGHFRMTTYNTAANLPTEMWANANVGAYLWTFSSKVAVDYSAKKFSTTDLVAANNSKYPTEKVQIIDGKILTGAAKTPSGMPADSIVFYTKFSNDSDALTYKVAGFRRTGFEQDDF
jgi:predicted small secreted protein